MVGLIIVAVGMSAVILVIFRYTSNQDKIKTTKDKIKGHLLGIRLFRDDPILIFRGLGAVLKANAIYIGLTLVSLVFIIVPVILIMIHLDHYLGFRPLKEGETAIVAVKFKDSIPENRDEVSLGLSGQRQQRMKPGTRVESAIPNEGILIDSPALFIPDTNEINWRIKAVRDGDHEIVVQIGDVKISKTVSVYPKNLKISPVRVAPSFFPQILHPVEPPITEYDKIESISISYKPYEMNVFGFEIHWMIVFFVLTIIIAFALKGVFGVQI